MEAVAVEAIMEAIVEAIVEAMVKAIDEEAIADKAVMKAIVDEAIMETMEVVSVAPGVTRQYAETNCYRSHQNQSHCAGNFRVTIFHCLFSIVVHSWYERFTQGLTQLGTRKPNTRFPSLFA